MGSQVRMRALPDAIAPTVVFSTTLGTVSSSGNQVYADCPVLTFLLSLFVRDPQFPFHSTLRPLLSQISVFEIKSQSAPVTSSYS